MPGAQTISQIVDHESVSKPSTIRQQNVQDDFMSAPLILPALSAPVFHFLIRLPRELQLHIFTLLLDSLIGKTRGLTPYPVDDYTQIRQLMDCSYLKAILRTNKHIRNLVLSAWKTALGTHRHLNNARQERRVEKALMLIGLLQDKTAHVNSMRLLLTCNASWEEVKYRAWQLSAFGNGQLVFKAKKLGSLFDRLAVSSITIELHVLTYATNGWITTTQQSCGKLFPWMLHYCPDLCQSYYLYAFSACSTLREFEDTWKKKCVETQELVEVRGDQVPVVALSRTVLTVRLPWMKSAIRYDAVREVLCKAVMAYMKEVTRKMEVEEDIASKRRLEEIENST